MSWHTNRRIICFILFCISGWGCRDEQDNPNQSDAHEAAMKCSTTADCPQGFGCLVYRHECISLAEPRNCLSDMDCTDNQICIRYAPPQTETDVSSAYCTFTCDLNHTEECIEKGLNRKCSTDTNEHDYNEHQEAFCGRIPSTCGNGRLDAGELCDRDDTGQVIFAVDTPTCQLWEPHASFKPGGIPGCSKTCIGYTKGSGTTKCVFSSEPNDVNGFDTCLASLYIDQDTYQAFATVNYATTQPSDLDSAEGYILCGPAGNTNMKILTDEDKLPEASTDIASCTGQNCSSRILSITRDLNNVTSAINKDEGQCVVYLKLSGSKLGIICDLTYKDNPPDNMPPTGTMPSAARDDPNACVTIAGTEDDFDIYEAFLANLHCLLSHYPYVSYIPPTSEEPPSTDATLLASWDAFPAFTTDAGYPIKAADGLELLQAGLPAENGLCVKDSVCQTPQLTLHVVGTNGFQKSSVTQTAGTQGLFETLQIGGSKNDWATEKPVPPYAATYLSVNVGQLNNFRSRRLMLKGSLKKGNLLITYHDGETEHLLAEDVALPSQDPACAESGSPEENGIQGCPNANLEGTLYFTAPDETPLTEFRIYVYGIESDNLNLNTVQVYAISNVIY